MPSYAYILLHGFNVLTLVVYCFNNYMYHTDSRKEELDDDARHKERNTECCRRISKEEAIDEGRKSPWVSFNYKAYDCYIILKYMYFFMNFFIHNSNFYLIYYVLCCRKA
jgi:hypothetical protein